MIKQPAKMAGHGIRFVGECFQSVVVLALIVLVLAALPGREAYAQKNLNAEATSRIFESIAENNLQGVKINLFGGADLRARNAQNMTPIEMAIDRGYSDIVFYLMAYRDRSNKAPPSRTAKTPIRTANPVLPPPEKAQSAVASVYTPPPGSAPWSAIVVTPDPPSPEPKLQGPSPFEPGSRAPGSGLKIIGNIRGPSGLEPTSLNNQTVEVKPEPAPGSGAIDYPVVTTAAIAPPEPAAPVIRPPTVRVSAPPPTRALAPRPALSPGPAPAAQSAPTVIPLHKPLPLTNRQVAVQDTPPPPVTTIPTVVTASKQDVPSPSPLFDDKISTPTPETAPPAAVELVSNALIPPAPVQEIEVSPEPAQKQPTPERKMVALETSAPGKPKDERGFFEKVLHALSFDEDETPPKQAARNRIVMDMPPPPSSNKKPDQIIDDVGGWEVKKIETAAPAPFIESAAQPIPDITDKLTVSPLTNINLSLLNDHKLGQSPPKTPSAEFKKSCLEKKSGSLVFCIVELHWPMDVANLFVASTVLYEGTKTIVRYDEGAATYYHTLFPSQSFSEIVAYYTARYGPPTKTVDRSIAPLASPRLSNPTVIWRSIAPVTKLKTTLEIRTYDDTRGGFPDTRRGVALLYHEWSRPVFPHVSVIELMILSANQQH